MGRWAEERGFTLVELMVVILIVGILIAVALPTFLGARSRSQDRVAQANLRTGLAAALTVWADSASYSGFDETVAAAAEPSLDWQATGLDPLPGQIVIQEPDGVADGPDLLLITRSRTGTYFCLRQLANSPAFDRGVGATVGDVDDPAECTGGW